MAFELQAFDQTGREQLTVKVDHDQNKTFVYSMEVQKHCVIVKFILFFLCFLVQYFHIKSHSFFFSFLLVF